ncbi:MAG: hypothetical protein QNK25_13130, partial [Desulfobacterales bacterium]|nr:hypothetical protein [Desulfobacterales bacterium]
HNFEQMPGKGQKSEARGQEPGAMARGRCRMSEVRGRTPEVGGRRSEDRGRRTEVGGQRSEDRGRVSGKPEIKWENGKRHY